MADKVEDESRESKSDDKIETSSSSVNQADPEEGRRLALLKQALDKTVEKCVSAGRFSSFAKQYKPIYDKAPKSLKNIYEQFVQQLDTNIKEELDTMFREENMADLLNKLDKIISETQRETDQPAWRPCGIPKEDFRAHMMQAKIRQKENLQRILKEEQDKSKKLQTVVLARRKQLLETQRKVEVKTKQMDENVSACDTVPLKEMQKLVQELKSDVP